MIQVFLKTSQGPVSFLKAEHYSVAKGTLVLLDAEGNVTSVLPASDVKRVVRPEAVAPSLDVDATTTIN